MKAQPVRRRIEQADERRDEPVVGQRLGEPVVDVRVRGLEVGAQPERDAQHRLHLRHRQRRRDAVARGVAEHDRAGLLDTRQVERVAAGQLGGPERAAHVVAGDRRHRGGQRAHLDVARHLELLPHLLAFDQRRGHAHPLQRDGALRGERRGERFVVASKTPSALFSTCITPTRTSLWSISGSVSMQRVR